MDSVHSRYLSEALSSEDTHKRVEVDGVRYIVMAIEGGRVTSIDDVDTNELNEFATSFLRAHKAHGGPSFNERDITHIDSQGVHFKDGHIQKNSDVRLNDQTSKEIIKAVSYRHEIDEDEDLEDEIDAVVKAVTPIQKIVEETNPASVSSIRASITTLKETDDWDEIDDRVDDVYNKLKQNMTAQTVWKVMKKTLLPARPIMMPFHDRIVDDKTRTHEVDDLDSVKFLSCSSLSQEEEEEDFGLNQFDDEFSRSIGRMGTWDTPLPHGTSTGRIPTHEMQTFKPFSPPASILEEEEETSSHQLGHPPQTFSPKVVHRDDSPTSKKGEEPSWTWGGALSYANPLSYSWYSGSKTTEQTKDKQDHTTPSVTSHPLPMGEYLESVSPTMPRTMREARKVQTPKRQVVLVPEETPQPKSTKAERKVSTTRMSKREEKETASPHTRERSPTPVPTLHTSTRRVAKGGTTISATVTMDRVRDEVKVKVHSNDLSTEERRKGREDALAFLKAPEVGSLSEEGKHVLDKVLKNLPYSVKGVASRELNAVQQRLQMSSF